MSAITSNGTGGGNWSSGSSWSGGVAPGSGDTATIQAGDTITVVSGHPVTIGTSPNTGGAVALTINSSATLAAALVIGNGATLTLAGPLFQNGNKTSPFHPASVTMGSGSSLIFKPISGQYYTWNLEGSCPLVCNGTGAAHCTVTTDLSLGGLPTLSINPSQGLVGQGAECNGGLVTAANTDFSNFGQTGVTQVGIVTYLNNTYSTINTTVSITNCTFNAVLYWWLAESLSAGIWTGTYTLGPATFTNSPTITFNSQVCGTFFSPGTIGATSVASITQCAFDSMVNLDGAIYTAITQCVFAGGMNNTSTVFWPTDAYFNYNLTVVAPGVTINMFGPVRDCYSVSTTNISHWLCNFSGTVTGCVFEQVAGSASDTYCVRPFTNDAVSVLKCFKLPGLVGIGHMIQQSADGVQITMEHCMTWNSGSGSASGSGISLGAITPLSAGMVASCRANIMYATSSSASYIIDESAGFPYVLDVVTVAGYNGFTNPTSGTNKYNAGAHSASVVGYAFLEVTNTTAFAVQGGGAGNTQIQSGFDFTADPGFFDSTRDIIAYANRIRGQANTWAAALAWFQANPWDLTGMIPWVRAGFTPTNIAYQAASYPGDTSTTDANGTAWSGGSPGVGPMSYVANFPLSVFSRPVYRREVVPAELSWE